VGGLREQRLRHAGHGQRIDKAGQDQRDGGGAQRDDDGLHGEPQTRLKAGSRRAMSLWRANGAMMPPTPYSSIERRNSAPAPSGRYFTPRSASGMSRTMISALKMTADRIALDGVASPITLSGAISG